MQKSQQKNFKEEDVLLVVRKSATIAFAVAWVLSIALLSWRILPMVFARDSVPLHYNIYVGIDAFGPWWMLFEVPGVALVIALANAIISGTILKKQPMLATAVWGATLFVGILAFIAMVRIVLINIAYG